MIFITIILLAIFGLIASALFLKVMTKAFPYLYIGCVVFLIWKFHDRLLLKYEVTLICSDKYFQIGETKYQWEDIKWYRSETRSAIMNSFDIGIHGSKSLKLVVTNKEGSELEEWTRAKDTILEITERKNIATYNYYNTPFWQTFAKILLASIIGVPIILKTLGFDLMNFLSSLMVWAGVCITTSMSILSNQKKTKNN